MSHTTLPANPCPITRIDELIERYDALLLDAYGVLVHRDGPLPGACELISSLQHRSKPFFIVSNTSARLPEQAALRYRNFGFDFAPEQIITSGTLIRPYFLSHHLVGLRCAVLGPEGSFHYVEQAGGIAVPPTEDFELLVLGDQAGYPFLEWMDAAISRLITRLDDGLPTPMILPNPDLIYPKATGFGFTSGIMAHMIGSVLNQRYPNMKGNPFIHLGKPEPAIFQEAIRRAGTRHLVMIGDQIDTDILGANRCGIKSALIGGGVSLARSLPPTSATRPDYWLESLTPDQA